MSDDPIFIDFARMDSNHVLIIGKCGVSASERHRIINDIITEDAARVGSRRD